MRWGFDHVEDLKTPPLGHFLKSNAPPSTSLPLFSFSCRALRTILKHSSDISALCMCIYTVDCQIFKAAWFFMWYETEVLYTF